MKSLGIVRKIDEVGRIVLPKELRRMFDLENSEDAVEIFVNGDQIVLKKYAPSCVFCKRVEGVVDFSGQKVCPKCIELLNGVYELYQRQRAE